jgi:hypothetical protein
MTSLEMILNVSPVLHFGMEKPISLDDLKDAISNPLPLPKLYGWSEESEREDAPQ